KIKMKTITIMLVLMINLTVTQAQTTDWIWAKQSTGLSNENFSGIDADTAGNVYAIGTTNGSQVGFACTSATTTATLDVMLVKYDQAGEVKWVRTTPIGTGTYQAFAVRIDPDGNPVITGNFNVATVTFGTTTLTRISTGDVFVVKYNPSGDVIWAKNFGGPGFTGGRHSIDAEGN